MSWLFATVYDPFMRRTERACLEAWRRDLLSPLEGRVLEIGAGTGANVPWYPRALERLVLTDADPHMIERLERAAARARTKAEVVRAAADDLPFDDASFDAVVSTLVLCSVPDVPMTLAEIRRVLRPGGKFVFLEHVASEEAPRLRWQQRLQPFWRHLAGNCHLARTTGESITRAGFAFDTITKESMRKVLPVARPTIRGVARLQTP